MFPSERSHFLSLRRIFWILSILGILITIDGLASFVVLGAFGPFHSGDGIFYSIQRWVESSIVSLDQRPGGKAQHLLDFADRRNVDLSLSVSSSTEQAAFHELELSVFTAVSAITQAGPEDAAVLRPKTLDVLWKVQTNPALLKTTSSVDSAKLASFRKWVADIIQRTGNPNIALENLLQKQPQAAAGSPVGVAPIFNQAVPTSIPTEAVIAPHFVYFPPGSAGARHEFYPLNGKHSLVDCQNCHSSGTYAGTPKQCSDCHKSAAPASHYPGECATCHSPAAWADAHFDHNANQANDCKSCHQQKAPPQHYAAQCSACHSIQAWLPAHFNHAAVKAADCQSCHAAQKPAAHYNGQCSSCHSTQAWKPASFNHAAADAVNCQSCHSAQTPANHYSGQCSSCHSTDHWKPANFNHAAAKATDCQSCHSAQKPANHYNGQCSSCHSTQAWKPAKFNHAAAGATDCKSCHSAQKPANHYTWQCSTCHSTGGWTQANFNHTFPMDHGGAGGICASCHTANDKNWTCFTCHQKADIDDKHKNITGYSTQCIACHSNGKIPGN